MYKWNFQLLQGTKVYPDGLVKEIHKSFLEGFELEQGWSIAGIRKRLSESTLLGLLTGNTQEIYGYAIYSAPDTTLNGTHMLWEDGICLRKETKGKGLSMEVFEKACAVFPERKFGWIGGRTQNPVVFKRYASLGKIFPFDYSYSANEGRAVMDYLLKHIAEVKDVKHLSLSKGICYKVYSEGRLGSYPVFVSGTDNYETQLLKWGFNRDKGDAVIVVACLTNPIQSQL